MTEVEILSIEFDGQVGLNEGAVITIERTSTANWCPFRMAYSETWGRTSVVAKVIDFANGIEEDARQPGYYQPTYNLYARLLEDREGNRYVHVGDGGDYCHTERADKASLAAELAMWEADDKEWFRSEHLI